MSPPSSTSKVSKACAVFDHSWKLLSAEEQGVFARCSVFRGGFTREAASISSFSTAWATGHAMDLAQAVAYALAAQPLHQQ